MFVGKQTDETVEDPEHVYNRKSNAFTKVAVWVIMVRATRIPVIKRIAIHGFTVQCILLPGL